MTVAAGERSAERELAASIEAGDARCTVVGLGYIGSALAATLLDAGFQLRGYDRSDAAAARFAAAESSRPALLSVGTSDEAIADADVVHVAVPVPCAEKANLEPLAAVAHSLRERATRPRLVVLHSTVPPGTTRWFAEECAGQGPKYVAHCPERLQPGSATWTIANTPHVVAGIDGVSARLALTMLRRICADVRPAPAPEVTELAKLMENAFIAVGVALAGEVASMAHALGVSGTDVAEAAATKPFSYHGFLPGPGVGGHCIPNDLAMLALTRNRIGLSAPLLDATDPSLARLPALTVARLRAAMEAAGRDLCGARVLLVGLGYKVGSSDLTNTPACQVTRLLRRLGATPMYLDTVVPMFVVDGLAVKGVDPVDLEGGCFDAALVLSGDPRAGGNLLSQATDVIIDAGGGRAMGGLPHTAERL